MADSSIKPIRVWTLAELDLQPDTEWQIAGVLPARSVGTVFGATGAGKTFVVLDVAMAIASGCGEWLGRSVRGGAVVYVAAEAAHSLRPRVRAYLRAHPAVSPAFFVVPDAVQLMSSIDVAAIIEVVERVVTTKVALIVFDTWSKVTPGADENSRQDMGVALAGVDHVCRHFDCGALLVHHTGGNPEKSEAPRGSSSLLASVDWAWLVTEKDGNRMIRCKKMRDAEPFRPIGFSLRPLAPSCVIEPAEPVEEIAPNEEAALAALRGRKGPVSATFWLGESGLKERTFYRVIEALEIRGLVRKSSSGYELPTAKQLPLTAMAARVTTAKPATPFRVAVGSNPGTGSNGRGSDEDAERLSIEMEGVA
jgi:AAA domain-containing protein